MWPSPHIRYYLVFCYCQAITLIEEKGISMTHYMLALDIGTSSIGYVAFEIDEKDAPAGILRTGVRIFSDGRDPQTKEPLAVSRRMARGIRRNRDRGQNRVRRLVKELIAFGLLPDDEKGRKKIFEEICPYEARKKAVEGIVDENTLGRALFHLGRRRGFKSNRLSGEAEETEFKAKIEALRTQLKGHATLGQFLYEKLAENKKLIDQKKPLKQTVVRFRGGETEFYADRAMYESEFDKIRDVQGSKLLNDEQWEALKETIFWQYPLKPVPKGKCRFYPKESRAHADLPITHEFRIYQEVNSLRYMSNGVEHKLDDRQRSGLYQILNDCKSVTFKGLLKKKDANKSPYFPSDAVFNLDVPSRNGKLLGNSVLYDLKKPEFFGDEIEKLSSDELNDIVDRLIEPIKEMDGKQVVMETSELEEWLHEKMPQLKKEQVKALCNHRFKRDTSSVSRKFLHQIVPVLKDTGLVYSDAVAQLEDSRGIKFHHSYNNTGEVFSKLPYYGLVNRPGFIGGHFI